MSRLAVLYVVCDRFGWTAAILLLAALTATGLVTILLAGGIAVVVSTGLLPPLLSGDAPAVLTTVALCCFMAAYTVVALGARSPTAVPARSRKPPEDRSTPRGQS